MVEMEKLAPHERVQQRTAKQSVDTHQSLEEIVETVRTIEQIMDVFVKVEG